MCVKNTQDRDKKYVQMLTIYTIINIHIICKVQQRTRPGDLIMPDQFG